MGFIDDAIKDASKSAVQGAMRNLVGGVRACVDKKYGPNDSWRKKKCSMHVADMYKEALPRMDLPRGLVECSKENGDKEACSNYISDMASGAIQDTVDKLDLEKILGRVLAAFDKKKDEIISTVVQATNDAVQSVDINAMTERLLKTFDEKKGDVTETILTAAQEASNSLQFKATLNNAMNAALETWDAQGAKIIDAVKEAAREATSSEAFKEIVENAMNAVFGKLDPGIQACAENTTSEACQQFVGSTAKSIAKNKGVNEAIDSIVTDKLGTKLMQCIKNPQSKGCEKYIENAVRTSGSAVWKVSRPYITGMWFVLTVLLAGYNFMTYGLKGAIGIVAIGVGVFYAAKNMEFNYFKKIA